ncbi:MAG TPA: hypothetical protein VF594_04880, partial [Rubricoccaceae bacterium]
CAGLLVLRRAPAFVGLAILALLATADLWGVGRRYVSDESPALQRRRDVADVLRAQQTEADRFLAERAREAGPGTFRVLPQNPKSTAGPSAYAESVGGYNGVRLANAEAYLDETLPDAETGYNLGALRLMAVRYVVAQGAIPGLRPVFQDPQTGLVVSEDSAAAPRAYLVDRAEVVPDAAAVRERVRSPQTDLTRTAFIAAEVPGVSAAALSGAPADSGRASVRLDRFSPDEIVWRVRTDRPRLFVASEVYYPAGWTATVGDDQAPIVEVNGLVRGVPVPAGDHIVTMRFRPEVHRDSVLVSWAAFFIAYGGALALASLLWLRRGTPA